MAARAATTSTVAGAAFLSCAERMPTATRRDGVRVVDAEAATHQAVHEVDGRAADVHGAGRVHEQAHAVDFDQRIVFLRTFLEGHAVLQTGAAAARDKYAQRMSRNIA